MLSYGDGGATFAPWILKMCKLCHSLQIFGVINRHENWEVIGYFLLFV